MMRKPAIIDRGTSLSRDGCKYLLEPDVMQELICVEVVRVLINGDSSAETRMGCKIRY